MKTKEGLEKLREKLEKFFEENPTYCKFRDKEAETQLRAMLKKQDFSESDLKDSGFLIHLYAWVVRQIAEDYLGEWKSGRAKATLNELKGLLAGMIKVIVGKEDEEPEEESDFSGYLEKERVRVGGNKVLYDYFDDLFGQAPYSMDGEVPDGFVEIRKPVDYAAVERLIMETIKAAGSTIKSVATSNKEVDDSRLSVAITFQAGLFLEKEGRVTLSQGEGDVIIGPFVPAPETDDLGP